MNAIKNQNKTLEALGIKNIYVEMFEKVFKDKAHEIRELIDETNHDYLAYYFKGDTAKKKTWWFQ